MSKLNCVVAVVDANASAQELISAAVAVGENVKVITCPAEGSFVNYIPAVIAKLKEMAPELVITATTRNGRLLAGLAAAAFETIVLSDVGSLEVEDGALVGKKMVQGGAANKTSKVTAPVKVACLGAGLFEEQSADGVEYIEVKEESGCVSFVEKKQKETKAVNLAAAKRVVCAGRGIANEEVLGKLTELAQILEAEMGCTRPIAEENMWMPKERYIGVSGAMLKPDFYLAAGVSGQTQHMVGVNTSKTIFAICKDKNAPIFQQSDYGIVGDAAVILPAIVEKLK